MPLLSPESRKLHSNHLFLSAFAKAGGTGTVCDSSISVTAVFAILAVAVSVIARQLTCLISAAIAAGQLGSPSSH